MSFEQVFHRFFTQSRCSDIFTSDATASEDVNVLLKRLSSTSINRKDFTPRWFDESTESCSDRLAIVTDSSEAKYFLQRVTDVKTASRLLVLADTTISKDWRQFFNDTVEKEEFNENLQILFAFRDGCYSSSSRTFGPCSEQTSPTVTAKRVNLRGKELQVATYFNPPLCYLKSTTGRIIDGIEADVFLADSERELDGIELQLFLILAEALNFTYVLRKPRGRYNHGRKFNETDWNGGMIGQVFYREVDMAFGGIWISLDNNDFVALSEPWSQTRIHFLVPRPRSYSNVWALARPLTPAVWILIGLALLLESVYLRGRARLDPRVPRRYRHLIVSLAESLGRLLGSATARVPPPLRLQFVLWQLVAVVLIACYNSSLSARLTNPDFERRIDTVKQFIEANLSWGRELTPPQFEEYFNLEDEYARQLPSRFVLEDSLHNRTQRLLKGNYAVIGKVIGDVYYPENFVTGAALQKLRVMREILGQFYLCFALRSWLLRPVNEIMMRLKESGIVLYHMGNVIHRRTGSKLREVFVEYDNIDYDRAVVLTINPLSAAFFILMLGLSVASLVFYAEMRFEPPSRAVRRSASKRG